MKIPDKIITTLQSRKFWVLVAALASIAAALSSHAIDPWQALQATIAALAVYSTGIALVDAGEAAGKQPAPLVPTNAPGAAASDTKEPKP